MGILEEVKKTVSETLPEKCHVTKVEMEGPEVAIYTKNPQAFFEDENFVAKVAFELKKRVNIRTDKSLFLDPEKAKEMGSNARRTAEAQFSWLSVAKRTLNLYGSFELEVGS